MPKPSTLVSKQNWISNGKYQNPVFFILKQEGVRAKTSKRFNKLNYSFTSEHDLWPARADHTNQDDDKRSKNVPEENWRLLNELIWKDSKILYTTRSQAKWYYFIRFLVLMIFNHASERWCDVNKREPTRIGSFI